LKLRIATARKELHRINEFDYVVVNPELHLEETVDTILSIIHAEHHNVHPRKVIL
jgi:guanylate kinase